MAGDGPNTTMDHLLPDVQCLCLARCKGANLLAGFHDSQEKVFPKPNSFSSNQTGLIPHPTNTPE